MANGQSKSGFSLKDALFNRDRIEYLADLFHSTDSEFDRPAFVRETMSKFPELELKARISHIAVVLEEHLHADFKVAAKQITDTLPPPLDPSKSDDDFGDFIFAPLGEYVVRNGLSKQHLKRSLRTLKAITQRFSMEDAIRWFINAFPAETMDELSRWSTDPNYHVRRLVSEGTRPLLPWSKRIDIDQTDAIPLLDTLHADSTRYVTRSVANHLNDISKASPKLVLDALKRWKKSGQQSEVELRWMSKHALRTLVKQGNSQALSFRGFRANPKIEISHFVIHSQEIKPGDAVEFSFTVTASSSESLMIDYVIDFVKANGSRTPKVHKLKQISLSKRESQVIKKKHVLRANATTYTLYPGTHQLTLQINGKSFSTGTFELL